MVSSLLAYTRVRVWLARGELASAERWADELQASWPDHSAFDIAIDEVSELLLIALARVRIATGTAQGNSQGDGPGDGAALDEALALLDRLQTAARSGGRVNSLIEALVLEAMARYHYQLTVGHRGQATADFEAGALHALEQALQLGEPEGYVRVFVDEGEDMQRLLVSVGRQTAHARNYKQKAYLARLLRAFPASASPDVAPGVSGTSRASGTSHPAVLVEPLSERELEIMRLIMDGMSSRDIARKLIVAPGTVKAHIASIYRKLDVHSRTQAVAAAWALGLLG
jgi:LuxR family maltose regulon positive regulatory protein